MARIGDTPESVRGELFYAGDVEGRARFDLVDPSRINLAFEPHHVQIRDVRSLPGKFSVDIHGFEFVKSPSAEARNPALVDINLSQDQLQHPLNLAYHDTMVALIRDLSGARDVIPQYTGLLVRTTGGSKKSWAGPANFVHLDYTAAGAQMHCANALYAFGKQIKPWRRFVAFQTWRAVSPGPQANTLAICDGRSVAGSETIEFESCVGPAHVLGTRFESRACRYSGSHEWYFLSDMEAEDVIVFKGFDTDIPDSRNAMHTAFDNPQAGPGAQPRVSIEARYFAFYD
jgi:hypothetical protein